MHNIMQSENVYILQTGAD